MSQANHTPIQLYYSLTPSALPSAGNLISGELALNVADGKLYYKNASGGVSLLADGSVQGSVTNVSVVSANGLAGTVATSTTTPAITLTTTVTGLLKGNGTAISAATAGTDYAAPTSGTDILYGNGAGGFSGVTIGSGIDFTAGTLSATGSGGSVTQVSVITDNGFAGTVGYDTTTPEITLTTTITGILKGDGTAMFAATSGTDYAPATSGTSILKGNGAGGFSNASSGTDYAPATSGTSILKANGSGGFSNAAAGTDYAPATSGTAILYGNGSGGFSAVTINPSLTFTGGTLAVTPPTSGTSILKGSGAGGFSNATAGTDYAAPTSGTSLLYGNGAGGFSNATVGSTLSFSAGTLNVATSPKLAATNWTVEESGGKLYFAYGGVNKASLDSSGNFIAAGTVTQNGTP